MVRNLTEKQRIEILIMRGCGDRQRTQEEVCVLFNNRYPDENPIVQSTVSKILKKFSEVGHVRDNLLHRSKVSEEVQLNVLLNFQENPHTNSRAVAADHDICHTSVLKYLKIHKWHPYKVRLVHELNEDDPDRRVEFCANMMARCNADNHFVDRIIFSDEATFTLKGTVNKQNCRYWAPQNPHWMMEAHTQYPEKVNVWAGIVGDRILGPYFIDGNLTGEKYLELLMDLVPALVELYPDENRPDAPSDTLWFQQDEAPPHYQRNVRDYLNDIFPGRWIGRRGVIEWPARSPDLTPLDYFLWGYLKSKVYFNRPATIETLKERIRNEIRTITPEMIQNVKQEFIHRLAYCQEVDGIQFEHLI